MKTNIGPADSWSCRCSLAHRTRRANLTTNYGVSLNKICYKRFGMSKVKNCPCLITLNVMEACGDVKVQF